MVRNARSTALVLARVVAVTFALSACGYLVVTAQRRANPEPVETPAIVDAEPASSAPELSVDSPVEVEVLGGGPIQEGMNVPFAFETTTTVDGSKADAAPFLYGSKSLTLPPTSLESGADANAKFLYSSKSGAISDTVRPILTPGTVTPNGAPMPPVPGQAGATTNAEPVFLPSSKVKTLNPQQLVPGTTSTNPRVFMHSSKSLRLDVQKPPAQKPVDPPKNP